MNPNHPDRSGSCNAQTLWASTSSMPSPRVFGPTGVTPVKNKKLNRGQRDLNALKELLLRYFTHRNGNPTRVGRDGWVVRFSGSMY